MMALARRFDSWFYARMPRERLALLRIGVGTYALIYLVARAAHLNAVVDYPVSSFTPLGLVQLIGEPLSKHWVYGLFAATLVTGALFTSGVFYRVAAPAFALLLLWVTSYRHAWGMIFHTDNLLVVHVLLLALAPAADAHVYPRSPGRGTLAPEDGRYGWVVRAMCLVTVASYVVAGVAKLHHTGWAWAAGGALREQVAYDAIRKIELGSVHSPFGPWLLPHEWLFLPLSAFSLATELLAPVALLGARLAAVWCVSAWLFHLGVLALMAIAFPYPLSGCAFLAFFPVERWLSDAMQRLKARPKVLGSSVGR